MDVSDRVETTQRYTRYAPCLTNSHREPTVLRGYQQEAVSCVLQSLCDWPNSVYFTLPTGTGKSVVLREIARHRLAIGRVLVLVHRRELVQQIAETFRQEIPDTGIVMGSQNDIDASVIVATVQTLRGSRLAQLLQTAPITTLLIDEAHHATASNGYGEIQALFQYHFGANTIGCTATPYRADRERMQNVMPTCVFARTIADMQEAGYLAPLHWHRIDAPIDLQGIKISKFEGERDYQIGSLALETDRPEVTTAIVQKTIPLIGDRLTVVFAVNVAHARNLAESYQRHGIRAAAIWGDMPEIERAAILKKWRTGKIQLVANCAILTEGFDFPDIAAIVLARPTQSLPLYMQCIGRGTRIAANKDNCLVIDVAGNEDRTDPRQIILPDVVPVANKEGIDAETERQERQERQGSTRTRKNQLYMRDPLHDDTHVWCIDDSTRTYFLTIADRKICAIVRDPGDSGLYRIALVIRPPRTEEDPYPAIQIHRITHASYPLQEALARASQWIAEHAQLWISHKDRAWRKLPPSEKQLDTLAQFNQDAYMQALALRWGRGDVSQAIDRGIFAKHAPAVVTQIWGGNRE